MANESDLSSILQTLSSLAKPQSTPPPTSHQTHQNHHQPQPQPHLPTRSNQTHISQTPPQPPASHSAAADPSTITSWPSALKHVMRTVSVNEDLQARIKRLIRSQHEHEKQWWQGREALLTKQDTRWEKKKQLEEVLYVALLVSPLSNPQFLRIILILAAVVRTSAWAVVLGMLVSCRIVFCYNTALLSGGDPWLVG